MDQYKEFCRLRDYRAPGAEVCLYTEAEAFALANKPLGMPAAFERNVIGKLMDDISALPVLWGLNEPGALLRNSDVFRVLAAAGREHATVSAPQVVADERAAFAAWFMRDRGMRVAPSIAENWPDSDRAYEGNAVECCWQGWQARAATPMQPVAVPDGWKQVPIEPTDEMVLAPGAIHTGGKVARIHRDVWKRMLDAAPTAPAAQRDAKDAERYLELRDGDKAGDLLHFMLDHAKIPAGILDAKIDTAIAARKLKNKGAAA